MVVMGIDKVNGRTRIVGNIDDGAPQALSFGPVRRGFLHQRYSAIFLFNRSLRSAS